MDLAALKAAVSDVDVTYKGNPFTIGYRPESVTEDDLAALEGFQDKTGVALLRATVEPLARLLVRWSLTDGPAPLAVDADAIAALPPRMRVEMLAAIMQDFFAPGNASPSDAGSPATAASGATAPSTPASSGTPDGPASLPGSSPGSLTLVAP